MAAPQDVRPLWIRGVTRCYYCDAEAATHIPDGIGRYGGGLIGPACIAVLMHHGAPEVIRIRLRRRAAYWRCLATGFRGPGPSTTPGPGSSGFPRVLTIDALAEHVASFCVWF